MANTKTNANIKARNIALGVNVLKTPSIPVATSGTTITKYERVGVNRFRVGVTVAPYTQACTNAALGHGKQIFDFPLGGIILHSLTGTITLSSPTCTATWVAGFGSVVASGAVSVLTGTSTFVDFFESYNMHALTSTAYVNTITWNGSGQIVDGSSTAKDLYMNFAGTNTASENATISAVLEFEYSIV